MLDISETYKSAGVLYTELSERYDDAVFCDGVRWRFLRRMGFRFGFTKWVELVISLREMTNHLNQLMYIRHGAVDYSRSVVSSKVFDDTVEAFRGNPVLNDFCCKAYASGSGVKVEDACLVLLMHGVSLEKVGVAGFLECAVAGVSAKQVKEWLELPADFRSAFYL